ncbi:hypothetical protein [Sphingobium sp. WCS2017Hpa-17]|uniref:hypothetical protein n=1 Tax=Sphingobium sp. WCS2017Hpa-17 TaxID=3073638 RepID=UPI00288AAC02|nr:hypothetical protein [Sphingobium sp. WCS2017Hpa-17]
MRTLMLFCLFVGFSALPSQGRTQSATEKACRAGIFPALEKGRFSGSIDCRRDQLEIRKAGEIRSGSRAFQIYDYRYRLAPICPKCAIHGGQRIIILSAGRYIGQYKPDSAQVSVERNTLVLSPRSGAEEYGKASAINFGPNGPPNRIQFDGEEMSLFR